MHAIGGAHLRARKGSITGSFTSYHRPLFLGGRVLVPQETGRLARKLDQHEHRGHSVQHGVEGEEQPVRSRVVVLSREEVYSTQCCSLMRMLPSMAACGITVVPPCTFCTSFSIKTFTLFRTPVLIGAPALRILVVAPVL